MCGARLFRKNCEIKRAKVKIHRIREVIINRGKYVFPVADWRRKKVLDGDEFGHPDDDDLPDLCDDDDDDEPDQPLVDDSDDDQPLVQRWVASGGSIVNPHPDSSGFSPRGGSNAGWVATWA